MLIKFWGVRGSIPTPGSFTEKYGGNTSCIEILCNDTLIIIDAGTGLRELGENLAENKKLKTAHIFISHTHWDHIQGFPFFMPAYHKDFELKIYGRTNSNKSLKRIFSSQMNTEYFPVPLNYLSAKLDFIEIKAKQKLTINNINIETFPLNHPGGNTSYKFTFKDKIVVYASDHEPFKSDWENTTPQDKALIEFFKNSNLLIIDSQYTTKEYQIKKGFGHSPIDYAISLACKARVENVILFHHDPSHTDAFLDGMLEFANKYAKNFDYQPTIKMAREHFQIKIGII